MRYALLSVHLKTPPYFCISAECMPIRVLSNWHKLFRLLRQKMSRQKTGLPPTRLEAAGYMLPEDSGYFEKEKAGMEDAGLGGEFVYHGALTRAEKIDFLRDIDLLCVPTEYAEPKGLFVLEALASGTPVVLPAHGAFPEILERTGGGILVEPKDAQALADSLENMICNPERRGELAAQGAAGVREHYSAKAMAAAQLAAFD